MLVLREAIAGSSHAKRGLTEALASVAGQAWRHLILLVHASDEREKKRRLDVGLGDDDSQDGGEPPQESGRTCIVG